MAMSDNINSTYLVNKLIMNERLIINFSFFLFFCFPVAAMVPLEMKINIKTPRKICITLFAGRREVGHNSYSHARKVQRGVQLGDFT